MNKTKVVYKKANPLVKALAFVGAITIVFALGYMVYCLLCPDDYSDYDDLEDEYEEE